jgi:hypothetical protein
MKSRAAAVFIRIISFAAGITFGLFLEKKIRMAANQGYGRSFIGN